MAGSLVHGDSRRLITYKLSGSSEQKKLLQQELLSDTAEAAAISIRDIFNRVTHLRLPTYLETSQQIAVTRQEMAELHQLFSYVEHKQKVENQQYFSFLFDASPLIAKHGVNNPYFELNTSGQMRLKKSIVEIPMTFWEDCQAAQQTYLGKAIPAVNSDIDVWAILTPPDAGFPYTCFNDIDSLNNTIEIEDGKKSTPYEEDVKKLESLAREVLWEEARLLKAHTDAFNEANSRLRSLAQKNQKLEALIIQAHRQSLYEFRHRDAGKVALIMTKTADYLEGRLSAEEFSVLINNIYGHAISSEGMQKLCNTMLHLCIAAAALGLVATLTPVALSLLAVNPAIVAAATIPSIAIAATSAAGAIGFGAGAIYSFFASEEIEQPQTGLSYNLAQIRDEKIEEDEIAAPVDNYFKSSF